ncbi:MAG: hypothetical protein ACKOB3_04270 [Holophagaceae bacterium]
MYEIVHYRKTKCHRLRPVNDKYLCYFIEPKTEEVDETENDTRPCVVEDVPVFGNGFPSFDHISDVPVAKEWKAWFRTKFLQKDSKQSPGRWGDIIFRFGSSYWKDFETNIRTLVNNRERALLTSDLSEPSQSQSIITAWAGLATTWVENYKTIEALIQPKVLCWQMGLVDIEAPLGEERVMTLPETKTNLEITEAFGLTMKQQMQDLFVFAYHHNGHLLDEIKKEFADMVLTGKFQDISPQRMPFYSAHILFMLYTQKSYGPSQKANIAVDYCLSRCFFIDEGNCLRLHKTEVISQIFYDTISVLRSSVVAYLYSKQASDKWLSESSDFIRTQILPCFFEKCIPPILWEIDNLWKKERKRKVTTKMSEGSRVLDVSYAPVGGEPLLTLPDLGLFPDGWLENDDGQEASGILAAVQPDVMERDSNIGELGHDLPESDDFPEAMSGACQSTTMKKKAKRSNSKSSTKSKHKKMITQTTQEAKTSKQTEIAQAECNELDKGTDDQTLKGTEESRTQVVCVPDDQTLKDTEESRTQVVCDEGGKETDDQVLENAGEAEVECNQTDKSTPEGKPLSFHGDPRLGTSWGTSLELYPDEIGLLKKLNDDGNDVAHLGSNMVDYLVSVALKGTELEQPDVIIASSGLYESFQQSNGDQGPWKAYDDQQYRLLVPICYREHYVLLDVVFDFSDEDCNQYFKYVDIYDSDLPEALKLFVDVVHEQQPTETENDTDYDEKDFDEGDTDEDVCLESEMEEPEPTKPKKMPKGAKSQKYSNAASKVAKNPKAGTKIATKRKIDCPTTTERPKSSKKLRGGRGRRGPTENIDICEENNAGGDKGGDKKDEEEPYDVKPMLKVLQKGLASFAVSKEKVKEDLLSQPDLILRPHRFKPSPQQNHNDCSLFAIGALLHLWFNEPIENHSYTQKGMTAMRIGLYRRWKNKETRDTLNASHILHYFPYLRKYKRTFAKK